MGAWGTGNLDNDKADDLVLDVVRGNVDIMRRSLDAKPPHRDDEHAIAAAEMVAAMAGAPNERLDERARRWAKRHGDIATPDLIAMADLQVKAILADSNLRDLWLESGQAPFEEWEHAVRDLISRLGEAAKRPYA